MAVRAASRSVLAWLIPLYNWINSEYDHVPIYCRFPKFEFAKFEFANFEFAKFEFPQFEFPQFEFAKFEVPKFKGLKMVQVLCDVSVFLQPTRGKEVPEKVQKKSQQSQEVCDLIKYTCYPLLCLLDLWSTFEGLMQLKQIHVKCLLLTIWNSLSFNNTGNLIASQHLHRICACSSLKAETKIFNGFESSWWYACNTRFCIKKMPEKFKRFDERREFI